MRVFTMMFRVVSCLYAYAYFYFRPLIKWFLHKTTHLCELQRICYGAEKGAHRAHLFEYSIRHSRNKIIQALAQQLDIFCEHRRLQGENGNNIIEFSASAIVRTKQINYKVSKGFHYPLTICLAQTFGYKQLIHEIEHMRKITYCSENDEHEQKLLRLWNCLMPDVQLEARITKQWDAIGFQGDDPKTDFRGMGILGLENLLFFASNYNGAARHVLFHSHHPEFGYSFAIVGINLTSMAHEFLVRGELKSHMFNVVQGRPSIRHFNQVYVYLFYEFDKFWLAEKPKNIMEFSRIRDSFRGRISEILKNPRTVLRLNFAIETV